VTCLCHTLQDGASLCHTFVCIVVVVVVIAGIVVAVVIIVVVVVVIAIYHPLPVIYLIVVCIADCLLFLRLCLVATIIPLANARRQVVLVNVVDVVDVVVSAAAPSVSSPSSSLSSLLSVAPSPLLSVAPSPLSFLSSIAPC